MPFELFKPDPRPEVEAARQNYIQLQAEADQLREISNDVSTPEGERAWEADHWAEVAWERYHATWHGPAAEPEAEYDLEPEAEP
jgi:hypothetical protein